MKQEINNEMDLLLRQLGRRQDGFVPDAEDHLDADELNSYAENVLPAKTRARYTEHLAACSRCRELVVDLSSSAGVVIAAQADKVSGPSGWRKFLASLFSPMVLRYAVPALGLIVVAAIGLLVLRREKANQYVSQVQNEQARPAAAAAPSEAQRFQLDGYNSVTKPADSAVMADSAANKQAPTQQSATPAPEGTPAVAEHNAPVAKAPVATKPESQPVTDGEPAPPSPTKLDVASQDKRQKDADVGRKQEAEVKVAQAEESKKNFEEGRVAGRGDAAPAERSRAAKSKSVVGDLASAQGAAAPGTVRDGIGTDDKEKDSSAETRSVAGKRFRKQKGIWIDTAYNQSREPMNLTRGTETYRSVVADEPGLKQIADQLDGEIVVVWKGRPYHIH